MWNQREKRWRSGYQYIEDYIEGNNDLKLFEEISSWVYVLVDVNWNFMKG